MDFANVSFDTDMEPPAKRGGGGGKAPIDFTPLFDNARKADGEWISFSGGSALNNYRTNILQGKPEGCSVAEFEVKVTEEVAPDPENDVAGEYRLYIRLADEETAARLQANEDRRAARAAAKAAGTEESTEDVGDDDAEASPLD